MTINPSRLGRVAVIAAVAAVAVCPIQAQPDTVRELAPGVYFHEGDFRRGHCNNGWIVFAEYVLVIDANFPSGAQVVRPKIQDTTDRPVRLVLDTHHHSDHAYGNRVWADEGAMIVAHTGVAEEMNAHEPGAWQWTARTREDVRATTLERPSLFFARDLVLDDGARRVEFHWFGRGHTKGDAFVWVPQEKILFTGDACVNGAFNYFGHAHVAEWIETLAKARELGAKVVCPGHGSVGGAELLVDQQQFLVELMRRVRVLHDAGRTPAEARAAVPDMIEDLKKIPNIARYVGGGLEGQAEKVWLELGGAAFPK